MAEQFVAFCPQCKSETAHKVCFLPEHRDCAVCLWCRAHHPHAWSCWALQVSVDGPSLTYRRRPSGFAVQRRGGRQGRRGQLEHDGDLG